MMSHTIHILADSLPLPSFGTQLIRMLGTLAAVLTGLLLMARFLPVLIKRPSRTATSGDLEIASSLALESGKRLYVVRFAGRSLLLASTAQSVNTLCTSVDDQAEANPADAAPDQIDFAESLRRVATPSQPTPETCHV